MPESLRPAGRGFLAGNDYYLPNTGAGVVRIDLARAATAGTLAVEDPLGDLVGTAGHLASVSPYEVRAFDLPRVPAERSAAAKQKGTSKHTDDTYPVHSLQTLLGDLATLARHRVRLGESRAEFYELTEATPAQQQARNPLGVTT